MSLRRPKSPSKPPRASKPNRGSAGTGVAGLPHVVEVRLPDGPVSGVKVWGQPEAPSTVQMVSRLAFSSNMLRLNVPKSPKKVTLVRLLFWNAAASMVVTLLLAEEAALVPTALVAVTVKV